MRVIIDRDVCIGSGNCMRFAPDVFDQDADAIVVLKFEEPPAELRDDVRQRGRRLSDGRHPAHRAQSRRMIVISHYAEADVDH